MRRSILLFYRDRGSGLGISTFVLLWLVRGFGGKVGAETSFYLRGADCDGRCVLILSNTIDITRNTFKNVPDFTIVEAGLSNRLQHGLKRMFREHID